MKNIGFLVILLFLFAFRTQAQTGNELLGQDAGLSITTGDSITAIGDFALYKLTNKSNSTALGYKAGFNSTIQENIYIGSHAGYSNTTGGDNVFIGTEAGRWLTTGSDNIFIGIEAGEFTTTGHDNTFVGEESGYSNITGSDNTFIGEDAGYNNLTGDKNTYLGSNAGHGGSTGLFSGYRNTAIGNEALYDISDGHHNTALGDSALTDVGSGYYNTAIGAAAAPSSEHTIGGTFVGAMSGWGNNRTNSTTNSNYNTYIGFYSGYTNKEGENNIVLGAFADYTAEGTNETQNNNIIIGSYATLQGIDNSTGRSGSVILGSEATVANDYSIAIGYKSSSTGAYAGALGTNASVTQNNSFVIGGTTDTNRMTLGIGTTAPNLNASIDLSETNKGFLINRMTTAERSAFTLETKDEGMMVYDSEEDDLYLWNGTVWKNYLDNTDAQNLTFTGTELSIDNGNTVDLVSLKDGFEANTDNQELSFSNNILSIVGGTNTVDFSPYLDNTDAQNLLLSGTELSIANGNTVDLAILKDGFDTNTDNQELSFTNNILSITGGINTVDFSSYLDNTDAQNLTFTGTELSIANGNTVDLGFLQDGFSPNTDNQELSFVNNILSIAGGTNTVDFSSYLDNTDAQSLSLSGTELSIANGNSVDLATLSDVFKADSDNQDLSVSNNVLSISRSDETVDLSPYLDNTDAQNLSLDGTKLSIANGNTVDLAVLKTDLSSNTDNQKVDAYLIGSILKVDIENGNSVSVDLSPIFESLEARIAALEAGSTASATFNNAKIYQNAPNPYAEETIIPFYIPETVQDASLMIYNVHGGTVHSETINERGSGQVVIDSTNLDTGAFFYTLILDGEKLEAKVMIRTE